jgi:aspartate aminotransferase-like enzyme
MTSMMNYWGKDRTYHHTPPVSLIYAVYEAMRLVLAEGLQERWERHRVNQTALIAGLEAMGVSMFVSNPSQRLPTVTAVNVPDGIDGIKVRSRMLNEFNIEIAGGLGPYKTKIWRVGLMGYSSQRANVLLFLDVLERILLDEGMRLPLGAGIAAAASVYANEELVPAGHQR